jgi:isoquinoline 1-oxidoreductase alpha subunit
LFRPYALSLTNNVLSGAGAKDELRRSHTHDPNGRLNQIRLAIAASQRAAPTCCGAMHVVRFLKFAYRQTRPICGPKKPRRRWSADQQQTKLYRTSTERRGGLMTTVAFTINGKPTSVDASGDTPLLWIVREHLKLTGTKFGCGAGLCGACTVHLDGKAVRSCQTQLSEVADKKVTTIEGLSPTSSHPLQKAWIAEQVPQCGYCQSGQIMQAAELLVKNPKPKREQIVAHMNGNICRCGTYPRIVRAIERAAREG